VVIGFTHIAATALALTCAPRVSPWADGHRYQTRARHLSDSGLVRGVGRWAMVALMINAIIGAGIFGLPSRIDALVGPWGLLAFVACAVVVASICLCFAEVSSRFTITGGPYLYARQAFGPLAGFLLGWLSWLTRVSALAVISDVMASYFAFFWAPAALPGGRALVIGTVVVVLTVVNVVGVVRATTVVQVLTVGKLIPLLLFVGVGLFFLEPQRLALVNAPDLGSFSKAVFQLVFAFGGFEAAVVTAGELKDPRRDIPFALLVAIGVTTLFYVSIQAVCIGTLPGLATSTKPLADASVQFMGTLGGTWIALGAILSTVGTLGSSMLAAPRLVYAMSAQRQLPDRLGAIHARYHTPHVAILMTGAAGLALALSGTFIYLLTLNVSTRLLAYLSTAGAMLIFRRRDRGQPALFSAPGGLLVSGLTVAACLWLLVQSSPRELRDVGIALALGLVVHMADRRSRSRREAYGSSAT